MLEKRKKNWTTFSCCFFAGAQLRQFFPSKTANWQNIEAMDTLHLGDDMVAEKGSFFARQFYSQTYKQNKKAVFLTLSPLFFCFSFFLFTLLMFICLHCFCVHCPRSYPNQQINTLKICAKPDRVKSQAGSIKSPWFNNKKRVVHCELWTWDLHFESVVHCIFVSTRWPQIWLFFQPSFAIFFFCWVVDPDYSVGFFSEFNFCSSCIWSLFFFVLVRCIVLDTSKGNNETFFHQHQQLWDLDICLYLKKVRLQDHINEETCGHSCSSNICRLLRSPRKSSKYSKSNKVIKILVLFRKSLLGEVVWLVKLDNKQQQEQQIKNKNNNNNNNNNWTTTTTTTRTTRTTTRTRDNNNNNNNNNNKNNNNNNWLAVNNNSNNQQQQQQQQQLLRPNMRQDRQQQSSFQLGSHLLKCSDIPVFWPTLMMHSSLPLLVDLLQSQIKHTSWTSLPSLYDLNKLGFVDLFFPFDQSESAKNKRAFVHKFLLFLWLLCVCLSESSVPDVLHVGLFVDDALSLDLSVEWRRAKKLRTPVWIWIFTTKKKADVSNFMWGTRFGTFAQTNSIHEARFNSSDQPSSIHETNVHTFSVSLLDVSFPCSCFWTCQITKGHCVWELQIQQKLVSEKTVSGVIVDPNSESVLVAVLLGIQLFTGFSANLFEGNQWSNLWSENARLESQTKQSHEDLFSLDCWLFDLQSGEAITWKEGQSIGVGRKVRINSAIASFDVEPSQLPPLPGFVTSHKGLGDECASFWNQINLS